MIFAFVICLFSVKIFLVVGLGRFSIIRDLFMLKKYFFMFLLVMLFFSSSKVFASDETVDEEKEYNPLSYGGEVDFVSRYVWRGLPFSDGPALEPSVWVSLLGVS